MDTGWTNSRWKSACTRGARLVRMLRVQIGHGSHAFGASIWDGRCRCWYSPAPFSCTHGDVPLVLHILHLGGVVPLASAFAAVSVGTMHVHHVFLSRRCACESSPCRQARAAAAAAPFITSLMFVSGALLFSTTRSACIAARVRLAIGEAGHQHVFGFLV